MRSFEEKTGVNVQDILENAMLEDPERPGMNPRVDDQDKEFIQLYRDEIFEKPPDLKEDSNENDVKRFNTY